MTAKEYLISQLSDEYASYSSVQTRKALSAYAIRIHNEVEGYSIGQLEKLIENEGYDKVFIEKCSLFVSNVNEYLNYVSMIPELED